MTSRHSLCICMLDTNEPILKSSVLSSTRYCLTAETVMRQSRRPCTGPYIDCEQMVEARLNSCGRCTTATRRGGCNCFDFSMTTKSIFLHSSSSVWQLWRIRKWAASVFSVSQDMFRRPALHLSMWRHTNNFLPCWLWSSPSPTLILIGLQRSWWGGPSVSESGSGPGCRGGWC